MKRIIVYLAVILFPVAQAPAQQVHETVITFLESEYWWGGAVGYGAQMPYLKPVQEFDLGLQNRNNQIVPLFVSSKGRYIWSDLPFSFEVDSNNLTVRSHYEKMEPVTAGKTLREAYLSACSAHFPPSGIIPDELFFTMPQYNTWIELIYDQNQEDILDYARAIIENGFPAGILMIDDNWQKYYGNFEFKPDRFPDPGGMVDELHGMGFKVMVWVCPFVSPDSPEYRMLAAKGYLLREKGTDRPAVIRWWNGASACYDLANPQAAEYLVARLRETQERYGVDGFKFDGGDNGFYDPSKIGSYMENVLPVDHTMAWARLGLDFPFNEYRACWRMGGQPLAQRLGDKNYSWSAVGSLIPEMTAAGLLGYAYVCPDMIGGGQFSSFLGIKADEFDQELIVRSAQVHALMPMMQFSVAPWRILDEGNLAIVREAALLHEKMGGYILECARESSRTGEPIVRHMEYSFPGEGFGECKDQYMLGRRYMAAPVVTPGNSREVRFPRGRWKDDTGKIYRGGRTVTFYVPSGRILYFERL